MNFKKFIFFKIIILFYFIKLSLSKTVYIKYNLNQYEQYGTSDGCTIDNFGVVLEDQYQLLNFSKNINKKNKSYYEGIQKLYSLQITDIPFGFTNSINFNVTNQNNETSNIIIPLKAPFECKKFLAPFEIISISDLYLYQGVEYGLNIGFNISNDYNIAFSFKCNISFAKRCSIYKFPNSYFVMGQQFIIDQMNKEKFTITLSDLFGGNTTLIVNNTIFSYSNKPSIIKSININPPNNSIVNLNSFPSTKVSFQIAYSELNGYPIIKNEISNSIVPNYGSLILGTPQEQTILFMTYIDSYQQIYSLYDVSSQIKKLITVNYTGKSSQSSQSSNVSSFFSIDENLETNNLLFNIFINISKIETSMEVFPIYLSFNYTDNQKLSYPYGVSKLNSNNYWELNFEGLLVKSVMGGSFFIKSGSTLITGDVGEVNQNSVSFPIPNNISGIITSDTEGPILHNISYQLLENNKMIITMNITDVGSGVLFLFCTQPYFSLLAKQALISGDINNGIYQFLTNVDDIQINQLQLSAYDYMGNEGLGGHIYDYIDLNFTSVNPILENDLKPNDITFFEFDRLKIDTSFDDLLVTLRINFTGASEYSSIPNLVPIYGDSRSGIKQYKGIFNQTTQMFDIKINVQARERGYFKYLLIVPPFYIYDTDIESIYPNQKVLLSTNYVDHFPPIITNLKSLTNVNLTINQGNEIEIGWDIEIYDYPVGLDYANFEIASDADLEPYTFTFKPNPSIPGSDILSTYTAKFKVKPFVNQSYFISSIKLIDKNGYNSIYPLFDSFSLFSAFYNNSFTSERYININVISSSNNKTDNQPPQLLSITFPTSFDSFGINRTAIFEFSIKDDVSGISFRHNPYIYIQFTYQNYIKVQSELVKSNNSTLTNHYKALIEFDYSSLAYGAVVSIHGITDNVLNIRSYSSSQLKSKGFPSTIANPIQIRPPVILNNTDINEDGGKLYIYGKEFTDSPIIYIDQGNGFEIIEPTFKSNQAITLLLKNIYGIKKINIKVNSKQLDSNIITIIPIIKPNQTITNCSILNECNGNGQCINSKCVCVKGFGGPDCSSTPTDSKLIINSSPSINSNDLKIKINQLDEIDISGKIIKSYNLESWNISKVSSNYQPNETYQYLTTLKETGTNITVTIDIFDEPTSISFASNTINMDKGTIKYTISLDSYPFKTRLNTLQLRIFTSIDNSDSKCKLNNYKINEETNNIEWIKLRNDNKSIYGKFIENALIDYRSITIQNKLLTAPTNENQNALIGIQIPFYFQTVTLDPDFSILVENDILGDNKNAYCSNNNSSSLSKSKIIAIAVVCGVFGISTIILTSLILLRRSIKIRLLANKAIKMINLNKK